MTLKISGFKLFTIGAYGFNENTFLSALKSNNIDTFCDIRQRRGMRGAEYSWANSNRLQANLKDQGIDYVYLKDLAPTPDIREKQKEEDNKFGVIKRNRTNLGKVFIELYKENCITNKNILALFSSLPNTSKNIVFFCVEKTPEACHRSLLANYLCDEFKLDKGGDIGGWKP